MNKNVCKCGCDFDQVFRLEGRDWFNSIDKIIYCPYCWKNYKIGYDNIWNSEDKEMIDIFWITEYKANKIFL